MEKTYLGDGVYVEPERGMLKLTSENGEEVLETIYLEGFVFTALFEYTVKNTPWRPPGVPA